MSSCSHSAGVAGREDLLQPLYSASSFSRRAASVEKRGSCEHVVEAESAAQRLPLLLEEAGEEYPAAPRLVEAVEGLGAVAVAVRGSGALVCRRRRRSRPGLRRRSPRSWSRERTGRPRQTLAGAQAQQRACGDDHRGVRVGFVSLERPRRAGELLDLSMLMVWSAGGMSNLPVGA